MKYTTLLFDLDNTLLDFTACEEHSLKAIYDTHFASHIPETAFRGNYDEINRGLWLAVNRGQIPAGKVKTERFKRIIDKFSINLCEKTVGHDYEDALATHVYWMPETKEALAHLKNHYKIGIITNGLTKVQNIKCQKTQLNEWCQSILISEEVGIAKPNPAIFSLALQQLDSKPEECLMFGDSLHSDYAGATNSGIDFCWVKYRQIQDESPDKLPKYEIQHLSEMLDELKA